MMCQELCKDIVQSWEPFEIERQCRMPHCFGTELGCAMLWDRGWYPTEADVPSAAMPAALHTVGRTFSFSLQPARLSCSTWLVVAYAMHALVAIFLLGDKNVDAYSMTMYALVAHWRTSLVGGPGWFFGGFFWRCFWNVR